MRLESNGYVIINREEVVDEDDVVLPASHQKSAVFRKLQSEYIGAVPGLVLLQQQQRLEATIHASTFIDCETLILPNSKQNPIRTEHGRSDGSFEVELADDEVALEVEERGVAGVVDGD